MPSFTIESADLASEGPIVEVTLGLTEEAAAAVLSAGSSLPDPVRIAALIDTGASHSFVENGALKPLGLHPVGLAYIGTPSSEKVECALYAVRLTLPGQSVWVDTTVIQGPPDGLAGQPIQGLIGRDVLEQGILIYNGTIGEFTLSF